jgi:hypothetical protein
MEFGTVKPSLTLSLPPSVCLCLCLCLFLCLFLSLSLSHTHSLFLSHTHVGHVEFGVVNRVQDNFMILRLRCERP